MTLPVSAGASAFALYDDATHAVTNIVVTSPGWGYADGRWQGFQSDIDVTIDLGEKKAIHYVGATFLCQPGPDIFLPREVVISVSNDNAEFTRMAVLPDESGTPSQSYVLFGAPMDCEARYVRFQAAQYQEWLFLDEIVVN